MQIMPTLMTSIIFLSIFVVFSKQLDLESNNIRDLPRQLFHCHGLRVLKAGDNSLHTLPSAVSSLTQLTELDVSKNVLTDIPDTIKQCKQLSVLDASVNPLRKVKRFS